MNDKKLTLEELEYVQKEVATYTKNSTVAYLFAIFLGLLGIHRAYFGKKITAILKGLITLFGSITLGLIIFNMATIDMSGDLTVEILADNAALAISFIVFTSVGIIWYLIDLMLIPSWKRKWDETNRIKAIEEVITGRHVSTQLLREQLSEELIDDAKRKTVDRISKILLTLDHEELHRMSEPVIPKLPEEISDNKDIQHSEDSVGKQLEESDDEDDVNAEPIDETKVEVVAEQVEVEITEQAEVNLDDNKTVTTEEISHNSESDIK